MKYAKPSQDSSADFGAVTDYLDQLGIGVQSGAWMAGVLTIEVEQPLPEEVLQALELVEGQVE